ncbi:MAG: phosphoglycerate dehydrogenase [Candidatus Omnitrophota bacterium]
MKVKILTSTSSFGSYDVSPLNKLRDADFEVIGNPYKRKLSREEVLALLPGVTGLIAGVEPLDRDVLQQSQLRVISRVGAGVSNIDLKAAERLGIKICSTPDAPTNAVAELTIAGMLTCLRKISWMDRDLHAGKWQRQDGYQLEGKNVAIIGFGRIGRRVAELLMPFNVHLLIVDPFCSDKSIRTVTLETALSQADIITFHTSGDECILSRDLFKILKPGVVICNAARGGLIDESALIDYLDAGGILGCWLDTFENEPYKGRLSTYQNVVLTPHVGSFTRECRIKMEMQAVDNLIHALS